MEKALMSIFPMMKITGLVDVLAIMVTKRKMKTVLTRKMVEIMKN